MKFIGQYSQDWKIIREAVYESVGRRCIRCNHPYVPGRTSSEGWSPCDDKCTHLGPVRKAQFPWEDAPGEAQWRILTCHHMDNDKSNNNWWNLLALCQRCHLEIQGKLDPDLPYFFEHSEWIKPYIAGFYAFKYHQALLTREEVMTVLEDLLELERLV